MKIKFILLHIQKPILYIIKKQHKFSPTQNIKQNIINYNLHKFILLYHIPQYTTNIILNKFLKNIIT